MTTTLKKHLMTAARVLSLALAVGAVACADYNVPNFNAGSLQELQDNPTPTSLSTAAQGMLYLSREQEEFYIIILGSMGREGYSLHPSDAGWRNNLNTMNPSFYSGSRIAWADSYRAIRTGNVILKAVDASTLTAPQKAGLSGFVKTVQAMNFLEIIVTRDSGGAPIEVDQPLSELAPIATRTEVYARLNQLLDQGKTDLQAAGASWILKLPPGLAPFNTPATFLQLNRAIRARSAVYTQDYATAIVALGESFLSRTASLKLGAFYSWSTNSGDRALSWLYDPGAVSLRGQPRFLTDAQTRADGSPDLRVTTKTQMVALKMFQNIGSNFRYTLYDESPGAPTPIIRNEDLILLRAEARWMTGDKVGAMDDLNFIRGTAGGLADCGAVGATCTVTVASPDNAFVDELLYDRRYSLVWEGGHRWIDSRRFGRLNTLPVDRTGDKRFERIQIPQDECTSRPDPKPAGCTIPLGI